MVLGKLPVPGRPINIDYSKARSYYTTVGAGAGCLDIFTLVYHFSFLSPSLWETAQYRLNQYRLKYCLKGPVSPKTTNQPTSTLAKAILQGTEKGKEEKVDKRRSGKSILKREEGYTVPAQLTLKAPNKKCSRRHFIFFLLLSFEKNRLDCSCQSSAWFYFL